MNWIDTRPFGRDPVLWIRRLAFAVRVTQFQVPTTETGCAKGTPRTAVDDDGREIKNSIHVVNPDRDRTSAGEEAKAKARGEEARAQIVRKEIGAHGCEACARAPQENIRASGATCHRPRLAASSEVVPRRICALSA
jgi:hypothetical protein